MDPARSVLPNNNLPAAPAAQPAAQPAALQEAAQPARRAPAQAARREVLLLSL